MTTPHRLTAQLDQLGAASTDAYRRLARLGASHDSPVHLGPIPPWFHPHLRHLAQALTTGTARRCPHLGTTPGVAHAAVWDPGHLTCARCTHRLTPNPREDTTCDRCRRRAELIYPGAIALGPVLLTFGLCPRCLTHTEPTRTGNRS